MGEGGKDAFETLGIGIDCRQVLGQIGGRCFQGTFDLGVRSPLEAEGVVCLHVCQLVEAHRVVPANSAGK